MSDNKKYYYMKLKENFFDTDEMIVMESMPDGYLYTNILMKLYLRSLKDNGCLMFKGVIPYTPDVLARVVRHNVGVVEKAIQIFKQLGLVEILDNGAIYMLDIQNFIGKSSTEADRKREYRTAIDQEKRLLSGQMSGQMSDESHDKNPPELEIELDIEKDKNIVDASASTKRKKFVKPDLKDVIAYCEERGKGIDASKWYDHYEANGWKVGKNPMSDWKAAVRTWERNTVNGSSKVAQSGQAARSMTLEEFQEQERLRQERSRAERGAT